MKMFHFILCFILPLLFGLTLCSRDYNPFSDPENCDIHFISQSKDTLNIFSTETVAVLITVPSLAKSLKIDAKKNRYFDSRQLPVNGRDTFLFSFYDTGMTTINFQMEKTTGDTVEKEIHFYIKSPLKNSTVSGGFDSLHPQTFKTGNVSDRDVIYRWKFFDRNLPGTIDLFSAETTGLFIEKINESGYGIVSVTDSKYQSTVVDTFRYSFVDNYPPQLIFSDNGPMRGDTILCGGESFYKIIKVTDRGCGIIQDVRINGQSEVEKEEIFKTFSSNLEVIEIFLRDASKNRNAVTLKYYVKNVSGIVAPDANLKFKILPDEDTIKVNTPFFKGFTYVEYHDKRTLNHKLNVFVNNQVADSTILAHVQYAYNPLNVNLSRGWNTVMAELIDIDRGRSVDTINVAINYDPDYKVDKKPTIFDVRFVNARMSRGQVVLNSDSLEVMVVAYDDKGKVSAVVIEKDTLVCNNNENQWSGSIPVFSNTTINAVDSIKISAIDSAEQRDDTTFYLVKNTRPSLKVKKPYVQIVAGKVYLDTLLAADADNDKLTYSVVDSAGKNIKIDELTGEIQWNTTLSDVNQTGHLFQFSVTDNYDVLIDSVRVIVLKDSSYAIPPVKFSTKPSDIPSDIESGMLYAYKLQFLKKPNIVYYNLKTDTKFIKVKDDTLMLNPQSADTGYHRVTLIAKNIIGDADSLYLDFNVYKANIKPVIKADSSLYKNDVPGITVAGSIDSFMLFKLWIDDPDITDKNLLKTGIKSNISNARIELQPGIDNQYNLLLFNSNNIQREDTLLVYCEDHGGLVDTFRIPVHYILKVSPAELLTPFEGEYIQSDTVLFRWNKCKASENVTYLVQTGRSQDTLVQTVALKDTSFIKVIKKSDTYRWRVITASGRDTAFGKWQYFYLHSPTHIQFSTLAGTVKNYCFADVDTYSIKLEIKAGTGSLSKKFQAQLIGKGQTKAIQVTDNGVLRWIPTVKDTGTYDLNIQVTDSDSNADTLQMKLSVVPSSGCHISLRCSDTALYCDNAVDLYGESSSADLIITVDRSRRSVFDTFNISVTSHGYAVNVDADSAVIVLQRPLTGIKDDTLAITARNKSSNVVSGTEKIIVRYNVPAKRVVIGSGTMALGGGLSQIPVLIRLDKNYIGFTKKCGFRFLTDNNKDTLRYQINNWNQSSKTAEVWVLFDTILSSGNSCVMEYGYQLTDNSKGKLVFDTLNNFGAVYHFEGLNDKSLSIMDQSGSANHGAFTNNSYDLISLIGSGIYYKNAINQISPQKKIVVSTATQKTVVFESWVRMINGNATTTLFDIKINPLLQCSFVSATGMLRCKYTFDEFGTGQFKYGFGNKSVSLPVLNEWARVALSLTIQSDTVSYAIHINGAKLAEEPLSSLPQRVIDNLSWTDGTLILCSTLGSANYDGQYDEVWISKIKRSDDWYKFSYENQKEKSPLIKIEDME